MLKTRVIPALLLHDGGLVKTVKFKDPTYVGDPINAVKIFNDKEVDELLFLDIGATRQGTEPAFERVAEIASECFMPLAYGGGIRTLGHMQTLFRLGVEKVVLNSVAAESPDVVREAAESFGSQSIVVSIDVKRSLLGKSEVYTRGGTLNTRRQPVAFAEEMQRMGAGEIILNSIDRDGTMKGYDIELLKSVTSAVDVPVIACGGAGNLEHFAEAVKRGGASAVSAGSLFVFHGRHRAVLISYPSVQELEQVLA